MGSKANPTVIGAFVVGAVALVVVGVLLFGGGKLFQEKMPLVIFFDSSVQGLNVGAPVVFRGAQVGHVTKVEALYDPKKTTIKRLGLDPTYPELPTVPTEIERLLDNAGKLWQSSRNCRLRRCS